MIHYDLESLDYFSRKLYRCGSDHICKKKKGILHKMPLIASAEFIAGPLAPNIKGCVVFKNVPEGTEVTIDVTGLPDFNSGTDHSPQIGPHGFHIHEHGNVNIGDELNPFPSTGEHWNPANQPHGNYAGDFPVLFSNHNRTFMTFFTDKFRISDIIGRSVVIHQGPDDYRSQPAGNSEKKLAAGVIKLDE